MRTLISTLTLTLLVAASAMAQKGIDTQTQKIKVDTNPVTAREGDPARAISWGKGKTRVRARLDNPYKLNARRDVLLENIAGVLRERKIVIDEAASRPKDGILVTQPFVFAKGPVTTQSELGRYGVLEYSDSAWSRAQYSLTIEIQSIDGIRQNVAVTAKVEGKAGNGLSSEWRTVASSGLAEDEFLSKLVEAVTGVSPDPVQDGQ